MSVNTTDKYRAAAQDQKPLKNSFDPVGANPAQAPEDNLDPVVAAARRFLQGFANLGTPEGARNTLYDAGYSGSVSSIILGSSAPNYDTGMGGSAGKQDDKKKQDEWDRLFRLQLQLAERLQEIDWEIEKVDKKIHDTKEHMSKLDREKAEIEERIAIYDDHLSGKKPLKVGADGKLENEKIEKALQDYERRTGKKVDRKNLEELEAAVGVMRTLERERLQAVKEEYNRCQEELDRYGKQKEELTHEKKTTENKLDETTIKLNEVKSQVEQSARSNDRNAQTAAEASLQEIKKAKQNENSTSFNDLNQLNDTKASGPAATETNEAAIALNVSAASTMDPNTASGLKDSFKIAQGQTQQQEILENSEITAQNKNPAVKPIS